MTYQVNTYEEKIKQSKIEKEEMINNYEDSISTMSIKLIYIDLDSDKIKEENSKMKTKIEKQQIIVKDQIQQLQAIDDELIFEQKDFEMKENENKRILEEFKTKIKTLQVKIDEYTKFTEFDLENELIMKKEIQEKEELEVIKMKLFDIEHQNQFLLIKVNEAERHLNEFKAVQNQPSFQQRLNLYKIKIKPSTKKN